MNRADYKQLYREVRRDGFVPVCNRENRITADLMPIIRTWASVAIFPFQKMNNRYDYRQFQAGTAWERHYRLQRKRWAKEDRIKEQKS